MLGGSDSRDLTDSLRGAGWPGAAHTLAELLVLDGLPEQPYSVELGDALYVDAGGAVTYVSPVRLTARREVPDEKDATAGPRPEAATRLSSPAGAAYAEPEAAERGCDEPALPSTKAAGA